MFNVPETVLLSGVTTAQLSYWRKRHGEQPPVLEPSVRHGRRIYYSFEDVIALRSFAHLRAAVSLPKVRQAVRYLLNQYPETHLSEHKLLSAKHLRTVVHLTADGEYVDLVERPGQEGIHVVMQEIYEPFKLSNGRKVPALTNPTAGIAIDPEVRNGQPCIDGTRVPYVVIAGLTQDGLDAQRIAALYPGVTSTGVNGAMAFAKQVAEAS
jgi:uncharacterized protein (DUF433 family)/DNA-binding transcriptional MerR regulator